MCELVGVVVIKTAELVDMVAFLNSACIVRLPCVLRLLRVGIIEEGGDIT